MDDSIHYFDYIIIGNGLAGLQLALKLAEDPFFNTKNIALIDSSEKNENDKTWSFWETAPSIWDTLVYKTWQKAKIHTHNKNINLSLNPYKYKSIRALDFYNYAKGTLIKKKNFTFIIDHVTGVFENEMVTVSTKTSKCKAHHVFDSRITEDFKIENNKHTTLIQHFKGWIITTENPFFEEDCVTMMDYRLKDGEQTTFMYVLPFSKTEALVEFTYFTETLVEEATYDKFIQRYIKNYLNLENYFIVETETGQIPMTTFPFEKYNTKKITKIGTAGGWVKASTGYSFKHTEKKIAQILSNLKSNQLPSKNLFKRKYKFYDKIFLKVLKDENHKGEWIFEHYYSKNDVETMFRFLDEESSFLEDVKIMWSLFSFSFIKAFFKTL
ncbi:lycopene cyclase family protein [Lacinutrix salivirga]